MRRTLEIDGRSYEVELETLGAGRFRVRVGERAVEVAASALGDGRLRVIGAPGSTEVVVTRGDREVFVSLPEGDYRIQLAAARRRASAGAHAAHGEISLPMPGRVVKLFVREGEQVTKGQPLLVVEAMKMEHTLKAPCDGAVSRLAAREGEMVEAESVLLEVLQSSTHLSRTTLAAALPPGARTTWK
jgi:biotin carboxyl carrier protein